MISLIIFFMLLSLSSGALTNYSVVALVSLYNMTLSAANIALSGFLFATAIGVLAGGVIADRTKRHGDVAAFGFGVSGVLILAVGTIDLGPVLLFVAMTSAGFLSGMISPSRDMLVRAASPPGAFGRVFGIVLPDIINPTCGSAPSLLVELSIAVKLCRFVKPVPLVLTANIVPLPQLPPQLPFRIECLRIKSDPIRGRAVVVRAGIKSGKRRETVQVREPCPINVDRENRAETPTAAIKSCPIQSVARLNHTLR